MRIWWPWAYTFVSIWFVSARLGRRQAGMRASTRCLMAQPDAMECE